ncbi:MAG: hypothetical protein AUJ92_16070 [Armatimonadetes bacterium CG2_30_59_28]|nr:hypothetical protein [Armatimonadota bacterium]OIO91666.1 MAG: hypothetical protein AUJ92_16070 [Armatimonadetes bacterium CG2_30_59_28]PIU64606.1 MAG: hypothetical protein COS85_11845 [Armatimonadetes bacterium CG07_land_8_20_14_0_80_59_28]PIX42321.1 MAG: hypothetical protein COZ56_09670 [Armatimonadetes bacterium CG_4_8_14_3_um_filter_58_9]PIY40458.1 MAG: hypothetical protein COZ05_17445 [Armatimonadetes bacterium CG_4_10_14_3_um_filter_59_10]
MSRGCVASETLIIDAEHNEFDGETPLTLNAATGLWTATSNLRAALSRAKERQEVTLAGPSATTMCESPHAAPGPRARVLRGACGGPTKAGAGHETAA